MICFLLLFLSAVCCFFFFNGILKFNVHAHIMYSAQTAIQRAWIQSDLGPHFCYGFPKTASYDKTDAFGPREKEKCQLTTSKSSAERELVLPSLTFFKINDGMNIMYDLHVNEF